MQIGGPVCCCSVGIWVSWKDEISSEVDPNEGKVWKICVGFEESDKHVLIEMKGKSIGGFGVGFFAAVKRSWKGVQIQRVFLLFCK